MAIDFPNGPLTVGQTFTDVTSGRSWQWNGSQWIAVSALITEVAIADNAISLSKLTTELQQLLVPTGTINSYAGASAPAGWLMCDGTSYPIASYQTLYNTIGTAYNNPDGAASPSAGFFRVPKLTGKVPVGLDGTADFNTRGKTSGDKSVTLTAAQSGIQEHKHINSLTNATVATSTHHHRARGNLAAAVGPLANTASVIGTHIEANPQNLEDVPTFTWEVNNQTMVKWDRFMRPGNTDGNNLQPGSGYWLKNMVEEQGFNSTAFNNFARVYGKTAEPSTSVTVGVTNSSTINVGSSTNNVVSADASSGHNNLQPYIVVNYIIKV